MDSASQPEIEKRPHSDTLKKLTLVIWAVFLLTLPFTNFPFFPSGFGGDALVRPLSVYPLIALLLLVTIPTILKNKLPKTVLSLLPFVLVAVTASLISTLHGIDSLLGISVWQRALRAIITLGIGVAIYLTTSIVIRSQADLRRTLRWIYAGWGIALLWSSIQAVYVVNFTEAYYRWVSSIQKFISTRRLLESRVSGTTYEPNWFAEQICILLLPWLLASVLSGYSVFRWRWRRITIELLLLGWSIVILTLTFSRAGLAVMLISLLIGLLFLRPKKKVGQTDNRSTAKSRGRRIIEVTLVISAVLGGLYLFGSRNTFFSRIWDYWNRDKPVSLEGYLDYVGFGARYTYFATAYRIYEQNPQLGVGLGNYAFYFEENLPDRLLAETPEVLRILTQSADRYRLITPKSLYIRILAETGLIGLGAFLIFVLGIIGSTLYLRLSPREDERYWGTAGLLACISFLFLAFTFDSFTFPNMWVAFGVITAATWVSYRESAPVDDMKFRQSETKQPLPAS